MQLSQRPLSMELVPFDTRFASAILTWVQNPAEAAGWANVTETPHDASIFSRWHDEQGIEAFVLLEASVAIAYGEVWSEPPGDEIELARIIVSPAHRRQGIGRMLIERLLVTSQALAVSRIFVRVRPDNRAALACYEHAGFVTVSPTDAAVYNSGLAVEYVWMIRRR